jgi:hypothetical protein
MRAPMVSFSKADCGAVGGNPPHTLPQSSAILVKVGCRNLHSVKVDCGAS